MKEKLENSIRDIKIYATWSWHEETIAKMRMNLQKLSIRKKAICSQK